MPGVLVVELVLSTANAGMALLLTGVVTCRCVQGPAEIPAKKVHRMNTAQEQAVHVLGPRFSAQKSLNTCVGLARAAAFANRPVVGLEIGVYDKTARTNLLNHATKAILQIGFSTSIMGVIL